MNTDFRTRLMELTDLNLEDFYVSAGVSKSRAGRLVMRALLYSTAWKFAKQVLDFDANVDANGLAQGSRGMLARFSQKVQIEGADNIPLQGPVLILSNHPGMADALALFSAIPRRDLRVLAASRPFLAALEAVSRYLIPIDLETGQRMEVLRTTAGHLRQGGAVLTFPAGKIEPDPQVLPGALESLDSWNPSLGLFARMVPGLTVVPVIVSGVIARQAVFHPLTRLRRGRADRERLGASLQLIMNEINPAIWPVTVHVRFAPAIRAADLEALRDPAQITQAILERLRPFLNKIIETGAQLADR